MGLLFQDIRYGLRTLARAPGFALIAILTLAIGIGANTAIFTLLDAVILKTLPVANPAQLVVFSAGRGEGTEVSDPPPSGAWRYASYPLYTYLRDHNKAFSGLAAFRSGEARVAVRIETGAAAGRAQAQLVSGNYFSVLGASAFLGRALAPEDDRPGARPAAVLSYGYWQSQFAGNAAAVGGTAILNRTPFTIVGVMPQPFFGERVRKAPDFWVPLHFQPQIELADSYLIQQDAYWLNLVGRLKPGESLAQANAIIDVQLRQFLTAQAGSKLDRSARARIAQSRVELASGARGISNLRFRYSQPLQVLLVAVGLVLLIACANVANLLLARENGREREISIRVALGATARRLVRQVLTESLVLAAFGSAAGVVLAAWGVQALVRLLGQGAFVDVRPDLRVLGFTVGVLLLTALLFGVAPALRTARIGPMGVLREHSGRAGGRARRRGAWRGLVVLQVAVSLWLLVGAGLLLRSLVSLEEKQFGFDANNVLLAGIDPRIANYQPSQLAALYRKLLDRLNTLPAVRSATVASYSPFGGTNWTTNVSIQGRPQQQGEDREVSEALVGRHYVETLGLKVLLGREIGPQDTPAAPKVAMVNEAFVRRFLPGRNPIGRRFGFGGPKHSGEFEIIGVVNDADYFDVREQPGPLVYAAIAQANDPSAFLSELELRTAGDPSLEAAPVRQAIAEVDPNLPVTDVQTLGEQVSGRFRQVRMTADVAGLFSVLALVLAAVGLYGLLAYSVAQRTSEIGVRMALGARPRDIFRMTVLQAVTLLGWGLALGVAGALGLTRALGGLLFGIGATDPVTYLATGALLTAAAVLACYVPVRRATRVDPATALRNE